MASGSSKVGAKMAQEGTHRLKPCIVSERSSESARCGRYSWALFKKKEKGQAYEKLAGLASGQKATSNGVGARKWQPQIRTKKPRLTELGELSCLRFSACSFPLYTASLILTRPPVSCISGALSI